MEGPGRPCQLDGRQHARLVRPGIYAEPHIVGIGCVAWRVAVDDELSERACVAKELAPNPAQVVRRLGLQRAVRIHAGVDKEIVAEFDGVLEAPEKTSVRLRDSPREGFVKIQPLGGVGILVGGCQPVGCDGLGTAARTGGSDPVGAPGSGTAVVQPGQSLEGAVEEATHRLFVVAADKPRSTPFAMQGDQPVQHLGRLGSAINIVSKEYKDRLFSIGLAALADKVEQDLQQVQPPVNIPDRKDASASQRGR